MPSKLFEQDIDYVEEDHIHAFAKALVWEHEDQYEPDVEASIDDAGAQLNAATLHPLKAGPRPDRISSKSDWYPVNVSRSRRRTRRKDHKPIKVSNEFRNSASYKLLRWPLLFVVIGWIVFLCVLYSVVRVYVALLEYLFTWVGKRKELRDKLRTSNTYQEWIDHALALDRYLNLDKWLDQDKFSYYDSSMVRLTIQRLQHLKANNDAVGLMTLLQGCLKKNFAGIENRQLYLHRYYGTKALVEEYIDEVASSIDIVRELEHIPFLAKRKFFKIVAKNYGRTALCLSGGACFAYTHFGIVKALLDNNLLPSIILGTLGGGLIAALACTRTDDELKQLLRPELARKITACEDPWWVWVPRWWKTGARFDLVAWARKANFFTRGSTTFEEAYERTGRILNVLTVPADPHSPVILCNQITSPNCIIWSSLLASSAVPGILNPVVLMMKSGHDVTPFSLGSKWRDGSLRTDIPVDALNTYFNVTFSIVSQVNPHLSLFFYAPKGTVGRPVASARRKTQRQKYASLRGGFVATALEQLFKLEIKKWLQIVKSLDLLPHFLEQDWLSIWLQNFSGSITIWPRNRLKDFWYILLDPTEERLKEQIAKGERSIFPKLLFIKHRLQIERAIEKGRRMTKASSQLSTPPVADEPVDPESEGFLDASLERRRHTIF